MKPRLRMTGGWWFCFIEYGGAAAGGATSRDAYDNWFNRDLYWRVLA